MWDWVYKTTQYQAVKTLQTNMHPTYMIKTHRILS